MPVSLAKASTHYCHPPKACDVCKDPIADTFSDAFIPAWYVWANVCPDCARFHGVKYGVGMGQRFKRDATGYFAKVEG